MVEIAGVLKRSWQSHFWTNLAATGVLTLSFSLILGTILVISNLSRLFSIWSDQIQITVYLKDEVTAEQRKAIEEVIKGQAGVDDLKYIDKKNAEDSFEKSLSAYGPSFLKSLRSDGDNPFPASFSVRVARAQKTPEYIESLAQKFDKLSGVEDVSYGQEWLKNYTMLMRIARGTAGIFTCVLLLACLFTVSNSVQASLATRRDEIEILELVGATASTIRKPFLIEGAFQGGLAATFAVLVLGVVYSVAYQNIEHVVGVSNILPALQFLPVFEMIFALLVGLLFGALGSYLCVARFNTGWAAAQESQA